MENNTSPACGKDLTHSNNKLMMLKAVPNKEEPKPKPKLKYEPDAVVRVKKRYNVRPLDEWNRPFLNKKMYESRNK